jgi:hypothetical protein
VKSTIGQEIVTYDLPTTDRLSKEIPDPVKIAIAEAVMAFSEMEVSAEAVIWELTGLTMDDGKLVTQNVNKMQLARRLSERYGIPIHPHPQTTADIWAVADHLTAARNKIAHGIWNMIDGTMPLAVSFRIQTTPGRVSGEHFPIERLHLIAENCRKIKQRLDGIIEHVRSLPMKPTAQSQEPPSSYPELPLPPD